MAQAQDIVALDVSKERLDGFDTGGGQLFTVANTPAGYRELCQRFQRRPVSFALEATGGYERGAIQALHAAGFPVRRVDPYKVRQFARAQGRWAKNDRIDAQAIAAYAASIAGRCFTPDPVREHLAELVSYRRQLVAEQGQIARQAEHLTDPQLIGYSRRRRAQLQRGIQQLDRRIAAFIAAQPALARINAILRSIPGVGPVLSTTFLAFLPELGKLNRKQIASLVGVAPFDRDSGKRQGARAIFAGRPHIRAVLYMAAVAASRSNPVIKAFYQRLRTAGKKPKVALVAAMRKLLVTANALIRDDRAYIP